LTVNGAHVIRERGNIPIDEIRKHEGRNSILGRFLYRGKLYTDFENTEGLSFSQAKCPILAYSNLPLGRIHILSEISNRRALNLQAPIRSRLTHMFILSIVGLNGKAEALLVAYSMVF
jgi:hypothetical protein